MEPADVFVLIKSLEKDLVKYYGKLKEISRLKEISDVFLAMETQFNAHVNKIDKQRQMESMVPLNVESIYNLHNKIKGSLFDKPSHEKDT